jgi:hypothetical protein
MKKLALALVCFVSVAFFASCTPEITNPEPSIAIMTGENYVYDGQTIDINTEYLIGFRAAANSQTMKELASFKLVGTIYDIDDSVLSTNDSTFAISGSEYVYQEVLNFEVRELIGKVSLTASVTDVDGKVNSTTITLNINQPAVALEPKDFSWLRKGSEDGTGLAEYGLEWKGNGKEVFAIIKPVAGAEMYLILPEDWAAVKTDVDKAAFFSDGVYSVISDFRGVSAWNSNDYNFVIGTLYNGQYHMIHITHGEVQSITNAQGQYVRTDITITGQSK